MMIVFIGSTSESEPIHLAKNETNYMLCFIGMDICCKYLKLSMTVLKFYKYSSIKSSKIFRCTCSSEIIFNIIFSMYLSLITFSNNL